MAAGLQKREVRALLFDRLMTRDWGGEESAARPPVQSYGEEGLRASIAEQLHWLLNTRVPIDYPTLDARTRQGLRSTVDYGLPDLSAYPVGEPDARARLHEHLAQTIALYEPRLLRPSVSLSPSDGRSDTLVAEVAGTIRIGLIETPVTFRFDIDTEKRAGHGG